MGKYTQAMEDVLTSRDLTNVMCDTYASCPVVQDGEFIGRFLAGRAQSGSIILLHTPERGLREWCFVGLELLLQGLAAKGLQVLTVGELHRRAHDLDGEVVTSSPSDESAVVQETSASLG